MLNAIADKFRLRRARRDQSRIGLRSCCIVTRLSLPERNIVLDGVVLEIGSEWALFREAAIHLFDRSGESVMLMMDGDPHAGRISATDERGFWIIFDEPIDDSRARDYALRHGVDPVLVI